MPQQTINIGAAPDDGTGDTLRVGGDKINDNFTELYTDKLDKAGGTLTGDLIVPDEAYDATAWNGSLEVPTKNAVRDKIESLGSGITELDDIPDVNAPTPANGDVLTWDSTPGEWVNAAPTGGSFTAASTTEQLTGTETAKGSTPDSVAALWEQGSDVASSGTISIGEGGYFNITGTTTITDIDFATDKAGRKAWVKFAGVLTLTHNASTLILPTGASITTAAGDTACFVSEGSDVVRCVAYNRATGAALTGSSSSSFEESPTIPTTSGYTLQNVGSATVTDTAHGLVLTAPPSGGSDIRFVRKNGSPPATPYSLIVRSKHISPQSNTSIYKSCLIARNSSNGRIIIFGDYNSGQMLVQRWSSYTAFSATALGATTYWAMLSEPWLRMRNDGTNLIFGIGPDGVNFYDLHTEPLATYINAAGGSVDEIGFGTFIAGAGFTNSTLFQSCTAA